MSDMLQKTRAFRFPATRPFSERFVADVIAAVVAESAKHNVTYEELLGASLRHPATRARAVIFTILAAFTLADYWEVGATLKRTNRDVSNLVRRLRDGGGLHHGLLRRSCVRADLKPEIAYKWFEQTLVGEMY